MANRNNFARLKLFGASFDDSDADHYRFRFKTGPIFAIGRDPSPSESTDFSAETAALADPAQREFLETDQSSRIAIRGLADMARFVAATSDIQSDGQMSDLGKAQKGVPLRASLVLALARHSAALAGIGDELVTRERDLFSPPAIERGDMESSLVDRELRDHFRALAGDQLADALAAISADKLTPDGERLLIALRRSVTPHAPGVRDAIASAWRASVERREPQRTAALATAQANFAWARHVVDELAQRALGSNISTDQIGRALVAANLDAQAPLFGIGAADVAVMRLRIAAEAETKRRAAAAA